MVRLSKTEMARRVFEHKHNIQPDDTFHFDEAINKYVADNSAMTFTVQMFNEWWSNGFALRKPNDLDLMRTSTY